MDKHQDISQNIVFYVPEEGISFLHLSKKCFLTIPLTFAIQLTLFHVV